MTNYRLELRNLHKQFPGVYAVKGVSFEIIPGEVHALVGENGAGKSTLMKMISGEYAPDQGEVLHNGEVIKPRSVADSQKYGIAMIHQELAPLPNMTIAENIFLGQEIMHVKFLNDREMNRQAEEILKEYKINFSPRMKVGKMSVAQIQMLEIIKAVRRNADIIIMDEPTSSLSDDESNKLFSLIKELTAKQVSIIYISHRLEEVMMLSDRVTVLRDGEYIKTVSAEGITQNELVEMMVGRKLDQIYPKEAVKQGDVIFSVRNFTSASQFRNINFDVKAGEILGVSGLVGAGRSEIMNAIMGLNNLDSGERILEGKTIRVKCPKDAIDHGIAMVSEDRKMYGLVLCRSIKENVSLPNLRQLFKSLFMSRSKEDTEVNRYIKALGIKCTNSGVLSSNLSGGNQQKAVLAKWLLSNPKVLILDEPTRGIDVGAKYEIYKIIVELAKKGIAIILISSELPEVMGMSDRILVVSKGSITGEYSREDIDSGNITQANLLKSALQEV